MADVDPVLAKTEEIVRMTRTMSDAMERLRMLRKMHTKLTVGEPRRGKPGEFDLATQITIECDYTKVKVNIADACPDLAERIALMIEAEDARLNDVRLAFVAEVNEAWASLTPAPRPRVPDRLNLRPVNLDADT
jgi:hypothetical protein